MEDQEPNSPHGIVCSIHGKQGLSNENYLLQLSLPDDLWKCPIETGHEGEVFTVYWDEDRNDVEFDGMCSNLFDFDDEPEETKADLDYHERKEEGY